MERRWAPIVPPEPRALQWTRLARGIAGLHCRRDTRALYTTGSKSHATTLWPLVIKIYIDGLYAYLCPCSISQCKTGLKYSLRATGVAESDHLRKTKQASSKDKHEAPETDRCLCGEELPKNPHASSQEKVLILSSPQARCSAAPLHSTRSQLSIALHLASLKLSPEEPKGHVFWAGGSKAPGVDVRTTLTSIQLLHRELLAPRSPDAKGMWQRNVNLMWIWTAWWL